MGAFVWFHRRIWMGLILLAGVLSWLYFLNRPRGDQAADHTNSIPRALLPASEIGSASETQPDQSRQRRPRATDPEEEKKELISRIHALRGPGPGLSTTHVVEQLKRRRRMILQLMEMELSELETSYALVAYIETISILDSYNAKFKLQLDGIREALEEIDTKYSDHRIPAVAAKANLAVMMIPGYEFADSKDPERFREFQQNYEQRHLAIFQDLNSTERLGDIVLNVHLKGGLPELTRPLTRKLLDDMQQLQHPDSEAIRRRYAENLFFGNVGVNALLLQLTKQDAAADEQVREMFEAIKNEPNFSVQSYALAGSCLRILIQRGDVPREQVDQLMQVLRDSVPEIEDSEVRLRVEKMIEKLEGMEAPTG